MVGTDMERRNFIKTVGASTAGIGLTAGTSGTAAAGSSSWDSYEGYGYLKFTPSGGSSGKPLVLALHGCTQEPDDFYDATQIGY